MTRSWLLSLCWLCAVIGCEKAPSPHSVGSGAQPTTATASKADSTADSTVSRATVGASTSTESKSNPVTISVAAASDLKFALDDVLKVFHEQQSSIRVTATYGSSGNLFAQLSNGAPNDIFLSADIQYPRKLVENDFAFSDSVFLYALGHIVIWVRNESPLEVEKQGVQTLLDDRAKKVAIANPKTAPYGRAAVAALKKLAVYEQVESRLVLGENIAQAAQYVETGAADIGVIALSLALAPTMKDKGRYWLIPDDAYPPLEQGGVILKQTRHEAEARKFMETLKSDQTRAVLKRYGFVMPGE